ncbi:MAG: M48 family metalloprotease [Planctomycetaceae bacterium]|nr:M48 family metalloprotease [Planctomycetaceae bacterium]
MWEQIESNRRKSTLIVTCMGVLLAGIGVALGYLLTNRPEPALLGGVIALAVWLLMWLFTAQQGDDVLLQMAGAREICKSDHPQLFNIVEEMSIAAELPKMPRVFIVDDPAPNAFAVGRNPDKASVAVTIGLLKILNRDELQGVVAHELGHIRNRDVALMTTAGIMLGAIVVLTDIGLRALWYGGGSRRSRDDYGAGKGAGGGAQAILVLVALVFVILSPVLAQLIYFALSRRREYLADASGAMFTRWPEGLASALEKLGNHMRPQADQSQVTAPMYIVRPLREGERRSFATAFSTHPPLETRIRVLRSMGGGADFTAYDRAFAQVTGKRVLGPRTLGASAATPAQTPAQTPAAGTAELPTPRARLRAASDAYLAGAGYDRVVCDNCGAILKIPPQHRGRVLACPRCRARI